MVRLDYRQPIPAALSGAAIALGNFDGFHLGHQAVVGEAIAWAHAEGRPAIVATFDPHPVRHFAPHVPPFRLTTLDQREELFAAAGADAMLVLHFDADLAQRTAAEFVELLAGQLGVARAVTGENFTFGKGREGNVTLLAEHGAALGLETRAVGPVSEGGRPVSSSRIRDALKAGDCITATRLMTRPFAIRGIVQHGDKRGRTIGYPTANLDLGAYLRPRYGIYAVTGRVLDTGEVLQGAASLGIRPTFEPPVELLEPYFFDFAGDLYGRQIEVALHRFLRPEARFDSLEALSAQMEADCAAAREALSAAPHK
jgi:riboflavin kinase / FMN adenylyltransferase